jgi:adenosylcobinamide-phosphate synthase
VRPDPLAAAVGIAVDRLIGEAGMDPHPVALFGTVLAAVERRCWRDSRAAGAAYAAVGVGLGATAGGVVRSTAVATWLAVAGRLLGDTASAVAAALDAGRLDAARRLLPSLAGRDASALDEGGIVRAVVESVAENTVDAVVAPALWGALLGPPGALGYRAANTLDAMVGHHSARYERFGWASARLDDVAGWVPARVTAALVAAVRPASAAAVWRAVRLDAPGHPSPNAGVAEAAFAAALGVRLGGTNRYGERVEERAGLGTGRPPLRSDIAAAVQLSRHVGLALAAALVAAGAAGAAGAAVRGRGRPPLR